MKREIFILGGIFLAAEITLFFLGNWSVVAGSVAGGLLGGLLITFVSECISMRRYSLTSREILNDWLEILHLTRRH